MIRTLEAYSATACCLLTLWLNVDFAHSICYVGVLVRYIFMR